MRRLPPRQRHLLRDPSALPRSGNSPAAAASARWDASKSAASTACAASAAHFSSSSARSWSIRSASVASRSIPARAAVHAAIPTASSGRAAAPAPPPDGPESDVSNMCSILVCPTDNPPDPNTNLWRTALVASRGARFRGFDDAQIAQALVRLLEDRGREGWTWRWRKEQLGQREHAGQTFTVRGMCGQPRRAAWGVPPVDAWRSAEREAVLFHDRHSCFHVAFAAIRLNDRAEVQVTRGSINEPEGLFEPSGANDLQYPCRFFRGVPERVPLTSRLEDEVAYCRLKFLASGVIPIRPSRMKLNSSSFVCRCIGAAIEPGASRCSTRANPPPHSLELTRNRSRQPVRRPEDLTVAGSDDPSCHLAIVHHCGLCRHVLGRVERLHQSDPEALKSARRPFTISGVVGLRPQTRHVRAGRP